MSCSPVNGGANGDAPQTCPKGQGSLPACGPFAVPFVVSQGAKPVRYGQFKALEAGTLYQDLDLPFYLKVNPGQLKETQLNQLRALCFAIQELGLYLDNHPYDSEAFQLYKDYVAAEKAARAAYVEANGPLVQTDAAQDGAFTWGKGPWPWQYTEEEA